MTLKCTVDGGPEAMGHPIFACHHCGKPVCDQHGWVVSADDAFDDSAEDPGRRMPRAASQSARRVPQPAMHCKQCVDKDHPRASKHLGWVDPKEAQRATAQARAAQAAQQQADGQQRPQQGQRGPQQAQSWGQSGQQYGPQPGQYPLPPQQQPPQQQGQRWRQANGAP